MHVCAHAHRHRRKSLESLDCCPTSRTTPSGLDPDPDPNPNPHPNPNPNPNHDTNRDPNPDSDPRINTLCQAVINLLHKQHLSAAAATR